MQTRKKTKNILLILLSCILLLPIYSYLEARWLKIAHIEIESADIPESFNGKRIVFISDVHHGKHFSRKRVAGLVDKINALNPDFIVIGGDNVLLDTVYIRPFFDEILRLKSKYGIYEVMGNNDFFTSALLTTSLMQRNKIKNCNNKSFWVRIGSDSIKIGGLDDISDGKQIPDSTLHDVKKNDFCILISHRPGIIPTIKTDRIDLTLSGHTHGGQITFLGLWAPILPSTYTEGFQFFDFGIYQKYRYGLIKSDNRQSYVTSGVGGSIPFRLFCRPEIAVLELKRTPSIVR
jgi:Predicted phosphohydrolases